MSLAKRNSEAAAKWAAKRRESQERALLQERSISSSISRRRTPACRETQPPPRNAASTSHEANAAYMADFRKGMADMYLVLEGPRGTRADLGASAAVGRSNTRTTALLGNLSSQYGKSPQERISHREPQGRAGRFGGSAVKGGFLGSKLKEGCTTGGGVAVASGWRQGPLDAAGQVSYK